MELLIYLTIPEIRGGALRPGYHSDDGYTIVRSTKECNRYTNQDVCNRQPGCVYHTNTDICYPMEDTHRRYCRCQLHVAAGKQHKRTGYNPYAVCHSRIPGAKGPGIQYCYRHYDLDHLFAMAQNSRTYGTNRYDHRKEWQALRDLHPGKLPQL